MPWWVRLLALGLRAPVERFAVRVFALGAGLLTLSLIAGILVSLGARIVAPVQERRLDRRWEQTVVAAEAIRAAHPPRGANSSAIELEQAVARFGLDIVPHGAVRQRAGIDAPVPGLPALRRWSGDVVAGAANGVVAPPPEVAEVLVDRRAALDEVVDLVLIGDVPRWEESLGADGPVPNHATRIALQRWLAAAAADSIAAGSGEAAAKVLEASWILNNEALRRPEFASRMDAFHVLRLQLALLRQLPAPSPDWPDRLGGLDPEARFGEAVLFDCWAMRAAVRRGRLLDPESGWGVARSALLVPVMRWMAVGGAEAQRVGLEKLASVDVGSYDPDAFFVDRHHQIPRWNVVARSTLPNHWWGWPLAVRLGLGAELTAAVMRIRSMDQAGRRELAERLPVEEPAGVPGGAWQWTGEGDAVRVRLVGVDLSVADGAGEAELPLEHLVPAS